MVKKTAMERKHTIIQPEAVRIRIGPAGFHRYASEFLRAAKSFEAGEGFSPVKYYLLCHSIELFLKAFLLANRVSVKELKSRTVGHKLLNILDRGKALGLRELVSLTSDHEAEIVKAHDWYNSKGFEYFQVGRAISGHRDLPDILILTEIAVSLESGLEQFCWDAIHS